MKKKLILIGMMNLIFLGLTAQVKEKITIPLTTPGERGKLSVGKVNGDIIVEGYSGQEVLIEATIPEAKEDNRRRKDVPEGMKRISSNPVEITAREDDNEVEISTQSWKRRTDLNLKIPVNFDLDISTVHGEIRVTNLDGELEVSGVNGPITMEEIEGSVLANTVNGEIQVRLKSVTPDAQMSFVTLHGDIDVSLPASVKAIAKMKSDQGDIFSDFDMDTETAREEVRSGEDCNCEYEVSINSFTKGVINGGGPSYTFKNMSGDIIIRKGN